ncbi:serine/threonine-protein kinase [Sorangium sp. So ce406]|uniref:serine/threonine-protein kinase n=1 Tax=Sorangium sp. So ce406 TaxID=3133311 RepID=UPI003F5C218B
MSAPSDPNDWRRYRPIVEIGRGGMADVCLAVAQGPVGFNKLVVLKRVRAELCADADILAMFLDEARLAARLNHPNVVQTYEVGDDGARFFIAMEYLDGQPLGAVRSRMGHDKVPLPLQVRVLCDALAGLHHAHELRDFDGTPIDVVHRDASPQNIFVTYDGVIKVVDFGIAKAADSLSETRTGTLKGKVSYMSPEQARGERVDRRSDIFSVGVILWEAIARRRMWKGYNDLAILGRLALGELPLLREEASTVHVDPELERICMKALAPALGARYATAAELQEELERWLHEHHRDMTARHVGAIVASQFAEDRARLKLLVEEQLGGVRWSGSQPRGALVELPRLSASPVSMTPTLTAPAAPSVSHASSMLPSVSSTEPKEPAARPGRALVAIAVACVAVVGIASVGFMRARPLRAASGPERQALAAASAATEPSPGQEAEPSSSQGEAIKLVVRVSPADAKLSVDGAQVSLGPYAGRLVRDGREHVVRAEAPGFLAREEKITASNDLFLSLSLERAPEPRPVERLPIPRRAPVIAATTGPAAAASPPIAPAPTLPAPTLTERRPRRAIDLESPYAR